MKWAMVTMGRTPTFESSALNIALHELLESSRRRWSLKNVVCHYFHHPLPNFHHFDFESSTSCGPLNGDQPWHICSTAMKENSLAIKSVTWQGPGCNCNCRNVSPVDWPNVYARPGGFQIYLKWGTTRPICLE